MAKAKRSKPKSKKQKSKKRKSEKAKTRKRKKPISRLAKPVKHKSKRDKRIKVKGQARKAPRGFVDVVAKQSPDDAYAEIRKRLESVKDALIARSIDARVRIHRYQDESIDGEVLVKIPRGVSSNDVALDMEEEMGRQGMPGFWINMGTRFTIKEDDEVYRRFRGFNDVNTHYQAAVPANWSEIPLILRKVILKGMEKKYGRKADSIYLRIHWSPDGAKPKTRG